MGMIRGYLNLKPYKDSSQQATNYVTDIGTFGIFVHPEGYGPDDTPTPTGWKIADALELFNAGTSVIKAWNNNNTPTVRVGLENSGHATLGSGGMEIFDGSSSLASFGSTARIGKIGTGYVEIQSSGIDMYAGSSNVNLAHIGYARTQQSTSAMPYYTFGTRYSSTIGSYSFVSGYENDALGASAFAEGDSTFASGNYSHSQNHSTTALGYAQTVIGEYNVSNGQNTVRSITDFAFIIGNGTSASAKSNALAVDWSGNVLARGGIRLGCSNDSTGGLALGNTGSALAMVNPSGTTALTVDWNGNISANSFSGRSAYLGTSESLKGYFNSTNEFNFVGTNNSQTSIYIGYRNNAPHISNYIFCDSTGSTNGRGNIYCNHLYASGDVQVPNNNSFRSYKYQDSSTLVTLLYLNTSNVCTFGTTSYVSRINGSSISSSTTISGSSDIRLKKDIEKIGEDTDKVLLGLEPISFSWKDKEEHDGERHYGISAQQLIEKLKEQNISLDNLHLVKEIEGYYGVAYTEFIPMLIHLCQSQQREIDELKKRI